MARANAWGRALVCCTALCCAACGSEEPRARLDLALCWGTEVGPCLQSEIEALAPPPTLRSVCGEAALEPIESALRVGDRRPFSFGLRAPQLDSAATLRLVASGSLELVADSGRVRQLDVPVASHADTLFIQSAQATSLGPGRIELSGVGATAALVAEVTGPLELALQPPRFRRLEGLAAQTELVVCSSVPSGQLRVSATPGAASAESYELAPAGAGSCPAGYEGYATLIWTGTDASVDVAVALGDRVLRCALEMPGSIAAVDVELASEPRWVDRGERTASTLEVRLSGSAAGGVRAALADVDVEVSGPDGVQISGVTRTDVDGVFSFWIEVPLREPIDLALLVAGRFRRLLSIDPSRVGDAGAD
jgi:hypothetical protein